MKQMIRAGVAATAIVACAGALSAQEMPKFAPDSYMAKIQQRGTFNAGVKAELLGVGYQNPMTGKFEGFAVDLGASLSERVFGKPQVTPKPVLGVTRIPMLEQGLVDVIIDTMFIMKDRWQQVDFAEPYWAAPTRILVSAKNNDIKRSRTSRASASRAPRAHPPSAGSTIPALAFPRCSSACTIRSPNRSRRSASAASRRPCSMRFSALPP